jgi:hypothetical protein
MENIINYIHEFELTTMDGYDDCIDGVASRFEPDGTIREFVVYDTTKVINKIMDQSGMSYGEALEFHEYNQSCAYVGENTPAFLRKT